MAKWGQGDPRWIVEERADATNVNNWHWTEKDASEWSKTLLKELFRGLKIEDGDAKCQTTDVSKVEGEASVNNRKAKTIVFYEWTVTIDWKGTLNDDDVPIRGTIEIPNLSEEIAVEDLEVIVKVKTDSDDGWKLKEMIRKSGAEIIRKTAGCYIEKLKTEFSQGLQLPRHQSSEAAKAGKMSSAGSVISDAFKSGASVRSKQGSSPGSVGYIIATKKIVLNTDFKTTANELYLTLTSRERLEAFTQGPVEIEATKGGRFSLLGGNVTGEFRELI
ncbi:activator of 90 kDa heat shock protein ATPase homolog 1-like isoform X2 [Corticium candelabrum]|nr:activator of 90 kDa heat shock protein ATPase homolog 1-like isoform X2 [Corticium candelabrum]